jgi:hypothetical protein
MLILVLAALYISLSQAEATTVVFDDGQIHDINYVIIADSPDHVAVVEIRDNNFLGQFTTVNLLKYGSVDHYGVGQLFAYDNSRVNVSGGSGLLVAADNSRVTCSGGGIGLITCNNSRATVSGGRISGRLWTYDNSRLTISGGDIDFLWVCNNSRVTITGGSIRGGLRTSRSKSASNFSPKADEVSSNSQGHRSPQVTISGGSINGPIEVGRGYSEDSVVEFIGRDFAVDGNAVGYGIIDTGGQESIRGILTGILADSNSLDTEFYIYGDSSIILAPVGIKPGSVQRTSYSYSSSASQTRYARGL